MSKPKAVSQKSSARRPADRQDTAHVPAYFHAIKIENFKCFGPEQTLDLTNGKGAYAPWTVVLGDNGTGKSTLLQALASIEFFRQAQPRVGLVGDIGPLVNEAARGEGPARFEATCANASDVPLGAWAVETRPDKSFAFTPIGGTDPEGHPLPMFRCGYGVTRRPGVASLSGGLPDDPTRGLFDDRAGLRDAEDWLLRLDYAARRESRPNGPVSQRLEQAKKLLIDALPDVQDVRFAASVGPFPKFSVELQVPYGWVPFSRLSQGHQTLATWLVDLASRMVERYPDSPDPLGEPVVVLVDEIDLHLHPRWQRRIITFLSERFPRAQFIVTAQSPLVAQAAADANLVVLRREGDHVVIDNDPPNVRGWRVDQILTSDLFGLKTARPPQMERLLLERVSLLSKSKLTRGDQARVNTIDAQIADLGGLPMGNTPEEIRRDQLVQTALDALQRTQTTKP